MPNFNQLPQSDHANAEDVLPLNQAGRTVAVSVATLQSTLQPEIILPRNMLLGRTSIGAGGPEPVAIGSGLTLASGILSANGGGTGTGQGFNPRGAWTASATYAVGDVVTYGGQTYLATVAIAAGAAFSAATWLLLAAKGDPGATGPQGPQGATGATGPAGPAGSGSGSGATVGTTAGTVAAGNDSRIVNALQPLTTVAAAPSTYTTAQRGIVVTRGNYPANGMFGWNIGASLETLSVQTQIPATDVSGANPMSLAGYANTLSTSTGAVGVYGQGTTAVDTPGVWGANFLVQNSAADDVNRTTGHNTLLFAIEADVNISPVAGGGAPLGQAFGLHLAGASTIRPTGGASAIHIDLLNAFQRNVAWNYGVLLEDGAADRGIALGARQNSAAVHGTVPAPVNSESQGIYFKAFDASGTPHQAYVYADPNASLVLVPGTGSGKLTVTGTGVVASGNIEVAAKAATSSGSSQLLLDATDASGNVLRASLAADPSGNLLITPAQGGGIVTIGASATPLKVFGTGNVDLPAIAATSSGSGTLGFNSTDASGTVRRASILADASGNLILAAYGLVAINGSQVATAASVAAAIQAVVGAAPAALATLQAIDAQMANDESAAAALTSIVTGHTTSLAGNASSIATLQGQVGTNTGNIAVLQGQLGITVPVRTISSGASVTMLATDGVLRIRKTTGSATSVVLEASPATGATHTVKDARGDASANPITITPATGTIDGAASYVLNVNRQTVTLQFGGDEWSVI